jgi:predicted amino acid racemase
VAYIELNRAALKQNFEVLNKMFVQQNIEWCPVTKMLSGVDKYLELVVENGAKQIADARVSNLQKIKKIAPSVETIYIKPPAKQSIHRIVKFADVSCNTEFQTIKWLSEEAVKQNKTHGVIIMIEMGDLREGVMGEDLLNFYKNIFELPNITVKGIGTNLNCLHGVMPSQDKLVQLSLYEQLIQAKFESDIPWVSGGTSVVIPLLFRNQVPKGINHFRVGETLYFGNDLFSESPIEGMRQDVIELCTEIIEITEKPVVPVGELEANPSGEHFEINEDDYGKVANRAILDIGLLDVNPEYLMPLDKTVSISGASSDMLIADISDTKKNYKVGDLIRFKVKYMGAMRLMQSSYIEKRVV